MIRQHQFSKVELVSITKEDESEKELERMLSCATSILDDLKIPYQVILLSSGDMGFSAEKTYDIENSALKWIFSRGNRTGRSAYQFFKYYCSSKNIII